MVRLTKLQSGFLDQVCQNRREIADIISRPLIETFVNLVYLLTQDKDELIEEYIIYSLRTEKRFLLEIEESIKQRGSELPIETRMKQSIIGVFENSSISPDDVDEKIKRQWGGNFREKAKAVDMEEGYLSIFGLPSHAVHGNWQDLITHHLEYGEGSFTPTTAWTHSRPQTVFGVAMFSVHANLLYARKLLSQSYEVDAIQDILVDLMMRVNTANELHEQFLQNKSEHL